MNNPILMIDPDGMAADSTIKLQQLPTVTVTAKKINYAQAAGVVLLATGARTALMWELAGVDPEPFTKVGLTVAAAAWSTYVIYQEIEKYQKSQNLESKFYKKGDKLPTPKNNPGEFIKRRGNQGWTRTKTGEIYKKSNTSHGNKNNEGDQ